LRLKSRKIKAKEAVKKLEQKAKWHTQKYEEKLKKYQTQLAEKEKQGKSIKKLKERIKKLKVKHKERVKKLDERIENRKQCDKVYVEKLKLQIKEQEATRDYNLATSLKSYIDPRVYKKWFEKFGFDWKNYYPKILQQKFSWIEKDKKEKTIN